MALVRDNRLHHISTSIFVSTLLHADAKNYSHCNGNNQVLPSQEKELAAARLAAALHEGRAAAAAAADAEGRLREERARLCGAEAERARLEADLQGQVEGERARASRAEASLASVRAELEGESGRAARAMAAAHAAASKRVDELAARVARCAAALCAVAEAVRRQRADSEARLAERERDAAALRAALEAKAAELARERDERRSAAQAAAAAQDALRAQVADVLADKARRTVRSDVVNLNDSLVVRRNDCVTALTSLLEESLLSFCFASLRQLDMPTMLHHLLQQTSLVSGIPLPDIHVHVSSSQRTVAVLTYLESLLRSLNVELTDARNGLRVHERANSESLHKAIAWQRLYDEASSAFHAPCNREMVAHFRPELSVTNDARDRLNVDIENLQARMRTAMEAHEKQFADSLNDVKAKLQVALDENRQLKSVLPSRTPATFATVSAFAAFTSAERNFLMARIAYLERELTAARQERDIACVARGLSGTLS